MKVIYADTLFLINLLTDYLLCLSAGRVCGLSLKRTRYLTAAIVGAAYSVGAVIPGLGALSSPPCKLLCLLVMGLIAYGREDAPVRCTLILVLMSAAFAGVLWAIGGGESSALPALSGRVLTAGFIICYIAVGCLFMYRRQDEKSQTARVTVEDSGSWHSFSVLIDSGNNLKDPMTGGAVMVVCPEVLIALFPGTEGLFGLSDPVELLAVSPVFPRLDNRLRLIPYTALSGSGMLAAFRPERITVDGKERTDILIAVSPKAKGEGFEGIL